MKTKSIITITAIIIALAFLLVIDGCKDEQSISKEQRISLFLDDLNQAPRPDSIRFHFSSSCADYATIDGGYFSNVDFFPEDSIPYSFGITDYDPNPVIGTASVTAGSFGGPWQIEFTMTKDGSDWYILKLVLEGVPVPIVQ